MNHNSYIFQLGRMEEKAILDRLNCCKEKDKETALHLLRVYLDSLE